MRHLGSLRELVGNVDRESNEHRLTFTAPLGPASSICHRPILIQVLGAAREARGELQ